MAATDGTRAAAERSRPLAGVDGTTSASSGGRLGSAARAAVAVLLVGPLTGAGQGSAAGTHIAAHTDVRPLVAGTRLYDIAVEGPLVPFTRPTRMARIRELAPLSLREWAIVLGVSYTTVQKWVLREPPRREKLTAVHEALELAARLHGDLVTWLRTPLLDTQVAPLDLLREERWRAFDGALRVRAVAPPTIDSGELLRRRHAEVSWATAEVPDEEIG